jgi:serine/threonine protein kinase
MRGMNVLRMNQIVHRDLKPENIYRKTAKNTMICKIGDFGTSKDVAQRIINLSSCFDIMGASTQELMNSRVGTYAFMSPQIY